MSAQLLEQYREAVQWLEAVADESRKTENVDLQKLISNCESCAQAVQSLRTRESDVTRLGALEQLSVTLALHQQLLVAKKSQLESCSLATPTGMLGDANSQLPEDVLARRRQLAIRDTLVHSQGVWFGSIAGLETAKQALREAVILPVQFPHLFTGGRRPWRRVLLYGPPGTGKTLLARAVSGEINSSFYSVTSSNILSSWVGESEKIVRELFQQSREGEGLSVVFIDEVDCLCRRRSSREEEHTRRVKTELLRQMDGADSSSKGEIFLLCATNCPWELDPAFLRRFQKRIFIPLPGRDARKLLVELHLGASLPELSDSDWESLLAKTEGYSGSDLANWVADAVMEPVREMERATHWKEVEGKAVFSSCAPSEPGAILKSISDFQPQEVVPRDLLVSDLLRALERGGPTVGAWEMERYEEFTQQFGQKA